MPFWQATSVRNVRGAQWFSGRVLVSRLKGPRFDPHCVVSLSKNINPSLVLVKPRKTCPYITERLLMGRKESNQNRNVRIFTIYIFLWLVQYQRTYKSGALHVCTYLAGHCGHLTLFCL